MAAGRLAFLSLVLTLPFGRLQAQTLATGRLLVATREVADPNFAETVVLLVRYSRNGAMGLVLNRPSKISLSAALEGMDQARGRNEPVYLGGPVGRSGALALLRGLAPPPKADKVIEGLHLISSRVDLAEAMKSGASPDSLRVYLGYAGWGADRLEAEVSLGVWHILPGRVNTVFDPYPGSLWKRLLPDAQPKLAHLQ